MCLAVLVTGCTHLKVARSEVNAYFEDDDAFACFNSGPDAVHPEVDFILYAKCKSVVEVARSKKGDWYKVYYKATFGEIEAVSGQWEHDDITFLYRDSWATPESGILLMKALLPIREGDWTYFGIAKTRHGNRMVSMMPGEERTHVGASGTAMYEAP